MTEEPPVLFDGPRVWREAQNVVAALAQGLYEDPKPDDFLLRDTLAGQYYVTAAIYAIAVRMLGDISTHADPSDYLKRLGLIVAQKLNPPSGFKDTPAPA